MDEKEKDNLEGIQYLRHDFIKTFYLTRKEEIFELYRSINGTDELNPKNWNHYANSIKLSDLVLSVLKSISTFTLEAIAYGEIAENYGLEMITKEEEMHFIAQPMIPHTNAMSFQIALRAFITMLNHFFFKDFYGKPFVINRGLNHNPGLTKLDNEYEYVQV